MRRFVARPFDQRWCCYTTVRPLWNEPRPDYAAQCWAGNAALVTRRRGVAHPEGVPFFWAAPVGNQHAFLKDAYYIPLRLRPTASPASDQGCLFDDEPAAARPTANLSIAARAYLAALGCADPDADPEVAGLLWHHVLAIGYSPAYLTAHAEAIRHDWPRIPLPATAAALEASAALGRQLAALLDPETPVPGVTTGAIRPELREVAPITRVADGTLRPEAGDLDVTANWGYAGRDGVTMPARGRADERPPTSGEANQRLGETTFDVYLNDRACWRNVPARVWGYHIGGYQVIKKWLSYREHAVLGRGLSLDEVREVTNMARRLAAIVLLEPELDANYAAVKADLYPWPAEA